MPLMSNTTTFEEILEKDGELFYTNVGNSMNPLIVQGRDVMIISKVNGRLKKYDVPLYKRKNGQYVLHRILKVRENDYLICGDNRCDVESGITDDQILGKLTGLMRNGKHIELSGKEYERYLLTLPLRRNYLRIRRVLGKIKRVITHK